MLHKLPYIWSTKTHLTFFEKNPVDIFWRFCHNVQAWVGPEARDFSRQVEEEGEEKEIASFYTYFVYELYCNTSEWGHGKKLELRVVLYYYIPTPPRGFLLVAYVEKFHSFLIYILMSPRVAVSRQGGSKPANQILLQDNYIHKYYDDNNVYVDKK